MADLYSGDMSLAEAQAVFKKWQAVGHIDEGLGQLGKAIDVLVGEMARLQSVATLARKVREAQKTFFRNRNDTAALQSAKDLERKLDAALKE